MKRVSLSVILGLALPIIALGQTARNNATSDKEPSQIPKIWEIVNDIEKAEDFIKELKLLRK